MNDVDIDLNRQLLSGKNSRELTGTKNSFRQQQMKSLKIKTSEKVAFLPKIK